MIKGKAGLGAVLLGVALIAGCDRFTSAETRLTRATASLESGKYQAALVDVRKALDSNPDNIDAQLLLVDVLVASGDVQGARQQLDKTIKAGAPLAATEKRQLDLLLTLGDRETLRKVLASSTTLSTAQRQRFEGRLLLLERRPADAQAAFDRALAADPGMSDAALGRIEAMAAQGQAKEATRAIDTFLERNKDIGRAWIIKGLLTAQAGDFAAAAGAFSTAIDHASGLTRVEMLEAHTQRVESYLATGQLEAARTSLAAMEAALGETSITPFLRAKIALASHDTSTAVNELRRFTQAAPQYMPGRLLLAAALLEQGSAEQAYAAALRNVAEFRQSDEPLLALARIQLRLGRAPDAEETLQPLIVRSPPNALAVAMMAEIRIRRGEAVAGASLLEQSLAERSDPRLQLQLAGAYLASGEAKRAVETLDAIQDTSLAAARDRLRVIATAAVKGSAPAAKELEAAVARHPKDVDLLLMAAAYHAGLDQLDRARSYLVRAREIRPDDSMLTLMLGRLELSAGAVDNAEKLAKTVLERNPNDTAAMMLMGGIASRRGHEADVDGWLNRARIARPEAVDVRLALARRAAARGDDAGARSLLAEAVRNVPGDPTPRIALAELDTSAGRYSEALSELQEAAKNRPNSPVVLLAMAKVQLAAKDTAAARKSLHDALELTPGWAPAASSLAALEISSGNLPAALDAVQRMRRADPNGAGSFTLEGDVYMAANRPRDAADVYTKAYRRTPSILLAARAAQAKKAAKIPAADAELVDWLGRSPTDITARRVLSELYSTEGKTVPAIQELEKVVEARPQDYVTLNNLAWLYYQAKDARALDAARKAYAGAPKVAAIADTYGWILANSGARKEGLETLRQAAQLAPDDAQIQFHFASVLAMNGDKQQAVQILRRITADGERFESLAQARSLLSSLADES